MSLSVGILNSAISEVPLAVIDFETTGLVAGIDRVVEVSVVRVLPNQQPVCVLDTLVNPGRPVSATEIHGITDEDVKDAPSFQEIAGDLANAICGCVVGAYNVYFDLKFLQYEMLLADIDCAPPYVCLMYMRPMLGLGKRCSLMDACDAHAIARERSHVAGADAYAAAMLWSLYIRAMSAQRVGTFGDLARLKKYKFVDSFRNQPLAQTLVAGLKRIGRFKSRFKNLPRKEIQETASGSQMRRHEYWECLKTVLSDLQLTEGEVTYLYRKQKELLLTTEEIRSLHGRAFSGMLGQSIEDHLLDDQECERLRTLYECLARLGWAPGQ